MQSEWRHYDHLIAQGLEEDAKQYLDSHTPKQNCRILGCAMCSIRDCPNSNPSHYDSYGCNEIECFEQQVGEAE